MTRWLAILPLLALLGFAAIGITNLNRDEKPTTALADGRLAPQRSFETLIGPELEYDFSKIAGEETIAVNLFASWCVAMDPTGQGGLDFGLTGVPETFVISPKGEILLHVRGPLDASTLQEVSNLLIK